MNKNIEDLFKDGFEGFEQEPKKDLWDKILQQRQINNLTNNPSHEVTPEHICSKEFKNFEDQPTEKVWRNVLAHINNRRQQKRYTRWSLLLLLLIGSCSSLVWLYQGKGDSNSPNNSLADTHTNQSNSKTTPNTNASNTARISNLTNSTASNSKTSDQKYASARKSYNTVSGFKNSNKHHVTNSASRHVINAVTEPTSIYPTNHESSSTRPVSKETHLNTATNGLTGNARNHTDNTIGQNTTTFNNLIAPDSIAASNADKKKNQDQASQKDKESKWWHGPNYFKYTSETDMNNEESNWKFGASVGTEIPFAKYKGSANDPLYNQFRKDDEKRALSYNAQILFIRQLGKIISIQTGFGYSSASFKGDYQHSIYTVQQITTPQGNKIYDTTYSYRINAQSQYRLNYLEIPMALGYNFGEGRFNFQLKAGGMLQLLASQTGSLLAPKSHQLEPIGNIGQLSANRVSTSLLGAFAFNYQIKHELSFFGEASYRYSFKALMTSDNQQQYINSLRFNLGFKFHIN